MSAPKILSLTTKAGATVLVNPFRVNRWAAMTPPTQQPHLAGRLGTEITFTGRDRLFVVETLEVIQRMIQGLKPLKGRRKRDAEGQATLL